MTCECPAPDAVLDRSRPEPDGTGTQVWNRRAARVLLVDEVLEHVLLVHGFDPQRPDVRYWFTVGGGIDEGEDAREAAVREVAEEIGHRLDPALLDGPLHPEHVVFSFDGTEIHQDQEYFVAVVPHFEPTFLGVDEVERTSTVTVDWVPLHGIPDLPDAVYPPHLAAIVEEWRYARGYSVRAPE